MSDVINKVTGQFLKSVHTPYYSSNSDWIINPTQVQIDTYKSVPPPPDPDAIEKERLIELKKREIAIDALKLDGVLDSKGELIK